MDKHYDYLAHEPEIYALWEENNAFNPDSHEPKLKKNKFSIVMPPPNANDPLHIGHALFVALEDTVIRFHRMTGDDTVWIPGTDHAGIETQFVFEKKLQKNGKSRFNYDRKTLFQMIWDYVQQNSGVAIDQMKRLGASADWSRFSFTLDDDVVSHVLNTFKKMHEDGLVYRDLKLVNYCTKCGTSYSELEVNYQDQQTPLYYVKYPLVDSPGEYISVATVRPEPIFADTHLAVNPRDEKHLHLVGKKAINPLTNEEMPIIADDYVDPEFGTGIVKLTPAHDPNDFELAKKHGLPIIEAINTQGKISSAGGKYAGMNVTAARKAVIDDLSAKGLIEKVDEKYSNRIGVCYRCNRVIEPLPMAQFFIKVKDEKNNLTQRALDFLNNGDTRIHGVGQDKILKHWLENLHDWNISRQIAWGINIPAWYQVDGFEDQIQVSFLNQGGDYVQGLLTDLLKEYGLEEIVGGLQQTTASAAVPYTVSGSAPENGRWIQETDTFDTWFSSAQWPVVVLKTGKPGDFERFYPTTVMETGYDILMFWVMRMMLMGAYLTGKTPFKQVYLHGLIRDSKGQKMSKSKGNTINPFEVVEKFGADALRMALIIRSTPGQDKSVSDQDFKAMRNLTNKVWNASRYIILKNKVAKTRHTSDTVGYVDSNFDKKFHMELEEKAALITQSLVRLKIGLAAEQTYNEFWHWYCDECIEKNKAGQLSDEALLEGLTVFLKLLHPFIPFVTEKVWQELFHAGAVSENLLATAPWPSPTRG